jgi:MFS family permease
MNHAGGDACVSPETDDPMALAAQAVPAPVARRRAGLLRFPGYRWLLCAHLVSQLGDGLYAVALPWMVWQHTHSGIATTGTLAASAFSFLIVGPIAGVYVDRWKRRRTLVGADLARAAVLVVLPVVLAARFNLLAVLAIAVLLPALGRFFVPAQRAAVPSLVPEDDLVSANGLMLGVGNAAYIGGPALGGLLIVAIGAVPLLLLDGLSFAISAAFIALIRFPARPPQTARRDFRDELAEGFRVTWRLPALRASALLAVFATVCFAPVPALLPLWTSAKGSTDAGTFGLLTSSFFVGSLVGGLLVARWGSRVTRRAMIVGGVLAMGMAIVAFGRSYESTAAAVNLALLGSFLSVYNVGVMTLLQETAPPASLGRVFAVNETFSWLLRPVAALSAGVAADTVGVHDTVSALGIGMLFLGVAALFAKSFRAPQTADKKQKEAA